jgi:hypothetical protein
LGFNLVNSKTDKETNSDDINKITNNPSLSEDQGLRNHSKPISINQQGKQLSI